jgi:hypothetical protein
MLPQKVWHMPRHTFASHAMMSGPRSTACNGSQATQRRNFLVETEVDSEVELMPVHDGDDLDDEDRARLACGVARDARPNAKGVGRST